MVINSFSVGGHGPMWLSILFQWVGMALCGNYSTVFQWVGIALCVNYSISVGGHGPVWAGAELLHPPLPLEDLRGEEGGEARLR